MERFTLTEDEILAMTNKAQRETLLRTWRKWPIWGELPDLGLHVHRIELPNDMSIVAAHYTGGYMESVHYQRLKQGQSLNPYYDCSMSLCIDLLTQLRAEIRERRKGQEQ